MANTLIVGVGADDGIGFQTAKKFCEQGHSVFLAGRNAQRLAEQQVILAAAGGDATAVALDATQPGAVDGIVNHIPTLDCVVHNVGQNQRKSFAEMDADFFAEMWRINSLSAFNVAKAATKKMTAQGSGSLLFTSASAALRGKPSFGAFASTRGGNRLMIQALAKELGPQNIHVAQVHVDGIVNGSRSKGNWPEIIEGLGEHGSLEPSAVADAFWYLHNQHRSAWTHELDLRPFKETF